MKFVLRRVMHAFVATNAHKLNHIEHKRNLLVVRKVDYWQKPITCDARACSYKRCHAKNNCGLVLKVSCTLRNPKRPNLFIKHAYVATNASHTYHQSHEHSNTHKAIIQLHRHLKNKIYNRGGLDLKNKRETEESDIICTWKIKENT